MKAGRQRTARSPIYVSVILCAAIRMPVQRNMPSMDLRRLGTLIRAVDLVFDLLPPELDAIPERDTVVDATIAI